MADLAAQLCAGYGVDPERVRVVVDIADVRLGIDTAIPFEFEDYHDGEEPPVRRFRAACRRGHADRQGGNKEE